MQSGDAGENMVKEYRKKEKKKDQKNINIDKNGNKNVK